MLKRKIVLKKTWCICRSVCLYF